MAMRVKLLVATVAAGLLAVPAANAGLIGSLVGVVLPTCGVASHPFAAVDGDMDSYYGFSNNGFESGANGWALSRGAYVGSGNEPWYVNGYGTHSLTLSAGASATSPGFCINLLDPTVRGFVRGSNGGDLRIQVVFRGLTGNLTGILNVGDVTGTGAWQASPKVSSLLALPLLTSYAQIRLVAVSGTWNFDDGYVDPCINRIG